MAKDTAKLTRQLSLVSYLLAAGRPVEAEEIHRDVEAYCDMSDDAFARRFYADRAELDDLGIRIDRLTYEDLGSEANADHATYRLRSDGLHLAPIQFTDAELAALHGTLRLLDGRFAYAEPLRVALQQISAGHPSPLAPQDPALSLAVTANVSDRDSAIRLGKLEDAVQRSKRVCFDYTALVGEPARQRTVDPYHLVVRAGEFYVVGRCVDHDAIRVFRLSRMTGKVQFATKAERDFQRPRDLDVRAFVNRAPWQLNDPVAQATIRVDERIAWQIERQMGRYGTIRRHDDGSIDFTTDYSDSQSLVAWLLGLGTNARVLEPAGLADEALQTAQTIAAAHDGDVTIPALDAPAPVQTLLDVPASIDRTDPAATIRPERMVRLMELARLMLNAPDGRLQVSDVCERMAVTRDELEEDISVLNVVNFGGGTYLLYAEIDGDHLAVEPDVYADQFTRPARLAPVEAKALVAAIDLIGAHDPTGELAGARAKIVAAIGSDPADSSLLVAPAGGDDDEIARLAGEAIRRDCCLQIDYYKANEDEFTRRVIEPLALTNGTEGWYIAAWDTSKNALRHFRLDRVRTPRLLPGQPRQQRDIGADYRSHSWLTDGQVPPGHLALVRYDAASARRASERYQVRVSEPDGSVIVEIPYATTGWLARHILSEVASAQVLAPADARQAVAAAARALAPCPA